MHWIAMLGAGLIISRFYIEIAWNFIKNKCSGQISQLITPWKGFRKGRSPAGDYDNGRLERRLNEIEVIETRTPANDPGSWFQSG
jgi:hypothetical protein